MPTISKFYGIVILFYQSGKEHNPPHIHARYNGFAESFKISDGELLNGMLPPKAIKLVKEFVLLNQKELMKMWDLEKYWKIKGLE